MGIALRVSWFTKEVALSCRDVVARLTGLPGAFQLRDGERYYFGAHPEGVCSALDPPRAEMPEIGPPDWPLWIGALPYEAFRDLERGGKGGKEERARPHVSRPAWQKYGAVGRLERGLFSIQGPDEVAVARLYQYVSGAPRPVASPPRVQWACPPEDGKVHRERVKRALEAIARGELYQVNLARRFDFRVTGDCLGLLQAMGEMANAPFAMAIDLRGVQVISTSPELFLDYSPTGRVITRPIKGTRPRSKDPQVDAVLRAELDASEKERAELAMVIDIERNDLGRIARPGSVVMRVSPHVVSYPTVHHREAEVEAQLRSGVNRKQLLVSMMPSGSVTGAPKVSAMELISRLERARRGLYTGALGYTMRGGGMRLSMAIRVMTVRDGEAHYFAGGGVVADSDPQQELEETVWKAEQMRGLVDSGWDT